MTGLSSYLRRIWRASLTPEALLTLEEAAEALPGRTDQGAVWIANHIEPTAELNGAAVYVWRDVLAALVTERPQHASPVVTRWREAANLLGVSEDTLGRRRRERDPDRRCYFASIDELTDWWKRLLSEASAIHPRRPTRRRQASPKSGPVDWAALTQQLVGERGGSD